MAEQPDVAGAAHGMGGDALDQACADRPEMAGQLTEWANNTFGHALQSADVRRLLAETVAGSAVVQGQDGHHSLDGTRSAQQMAVQCLG